MVTQWTDWLTEWLSSVGKPLQYPSVHYLLTKVLFMFQACRSCLKKISGAVQTSGQVTSVENIQQLDSMADEIQRTSSRWMDF